MQSESFLEKLFDETPDFDGSGGFSAIEAFLGDEVIKLVNRYVIIARNYFMPFINQKERLLGYRLGGKV